MDEIGELEHFAKLAATKRLGPGECASIAAAVARGCALAIDDRVAAKSARKASKALIIVDTQQLVVELIRDGMLDVATADAIKDTWERTCRFKLKMASFSELVAEWRGRVRRYCLGSTRTAAVLRSARC